ncbi:MAG: polysaccharide deacetylase family protein [Polymorphobacter sp.]
MSGLVLTYHSISANAGPTSIAPETFAMQMAEIAAAGFRSQRLADFARWWDGAPAANELLITFDDAFADFNEVAAPILARHGFSALVFVPTARLGGAEAWIGADVPPRRLMAAADIAALAQAGFEFGGHSRTHANLTRLDAAACEREVADCATELSAWTAAPVTSFAAPYGAVNPDVVATIGRHYRFGFGTRLGRARPRRDAHDLPRIEMHYFRQRQQWRGLLDGDNGYLRLRQGLRRLRENLGGGFG